jgi:hypothetical protein
MSLVTDDDRIELGLLRSLEIDELVSSGHLPQDQRFDESLISRLQFNYPEIILEIKTGDMYPAEQLQFEVVKLSLPRLKFDSLGIDLRRIVSDDAAANNCEKWRDRKDGDAFEFEMTALHLVRKTIEALETLETQ